MLSPVPDLPRGASRAPGENGKYPGIARSGLEGHDRRREDARMEGWARRCEAMEDTLDAAPRAGTLQCSKGSDDKSPRLGGVQ